MQFISLDTVYLNTVQKQFLHTNIVGVEIRKCHTVTERCTRQLALTAERNVKFHSSQTAQGQFTAENATLNEDHHEDTKLNGLCIFPNSNFLFYFLHFIFGLDSLPRGFLFY